MCHCTKWDSVGVTHCGERPPAGSCKRDVSRKELQGQGPLGALGAMGRALGAGSGLRPWWPGKSVTAQGPWVAWGGSGCAPCLAEAAGHPGRPARTLGNKRGWQQPERGVYTASSWAPSKNQAGK